MIALGVEELSKIDAAAAILMDVQNTLVLYPIRTYGSDYVKKTYLPQLTAEKVGAYALSEGGSGSDAFGMATRAEKRGDAYLESVYLFGTPDEVIASLQARADAGVEYFVLHTMTPDPAQLRTWVEEIIPNVTFPATVGDPRRNSPAGPLRGVSPVASSAAA